MPDSNPQDLHTIQFAAAPEGLAKMDAIHKCVFGILGGFSKAGIGNISGAMVMLDFLLTRMDKIAPDETRAMLIGWIGVSNVRSEHENLPAAQKYLDDNAEKLLQALQTELLNAEPYNAPATPNGETVH
ncbi:MAG: hypothetical protein ACWA40_10425 [Planktomarina sp.]